LARHIQKHSRLIAVIEALDNGKSIRETRDADVMIVVRHLYYYAGWAELMGEQVRCSFEIRFCLTRNRKSKIDKASLCETNL
jgi:acyl-CoA reductase-like NAD-dependent aldehyde dehydrogenase